MFKYFVIVMAAAIVGLCAGFSAEFAWSRYESRERARPQTPIAPFPYTVSEVELKSATEVSLAGTLTIPKGDGPFPAVVLLNVAGPNDRDMSFRGHKTMLVLADRLTLLGFATVRFDDRGKGGSTGDLFKSSYEDLTADALSAVAMLKADSRIAADRIGVVGMSEGGAISATAASRSSDIGFAILLSAPGLPGEAALRSSLEKSMTMFGISGDGAEKLRRQFRQFVYLARRAGTDPGAFDALTRFLDGDGRQLIPPYGFLPSDSVSLARLLSGAWYVSQLNYDPEKVFPKIACPVLAIGGGKDLVLPASENLKAIRAMLARAPTQDVTVTEIPGLNHILQTARTGSPTEYAKIDETISPLALNEIEAWLKVRFAPRR
jgi:uncharacterized protein